MFIETLYTLVTNNIYIGIHLCKNIHICSVFLKIGLFIKFNHILIKYMH